MADAVLSSNRRILTLTILVLCAVFPAATRAEQLRLPGLEVNAGVQSMIDCPAWVASMQRCFRLPLAAEPGGTGGDDLPWSGPDYPGIRRDTYYFLGLQLSIVGILYFMPESVSSWSDEQRNQHHVRKWWNNVTDPTWDEDEHYINYALHPYWGATYYVRARERGFDQRGAFWYSVLLSTLYEAGLEAFFEPISIQDLFVTPIVGSWMGGHFVDWRAAARERMAGTADPRWRDRALLVVTDPLGNMADFIDRRLGRGVEVYASPFVTTMSPQPAALGPRWNTDAAEPTYGINVRIRW